MKRVSVMLTTEQIQRMHALKKLWDISLGEMQRLALDTWLAAAEARLTDRERERGVEWEHHASPGKPERGISQPEYSIKERHNAGSK
jgi:hypothetical protein